MISATYNLVINLFNKLISYVNHICSIFYDLFFTCFWESLLSLSSLINNVIELFNEHPYEVCMNYWEHLTFSSYISYLLFKSSIKSIIHSIFPFYYKTSTTDLINEIPILMSEYGCRKEKEN